MDQILAFWKGVLEVEVAGSELLSCYTGLIGKGEVRPILCLMLRVYSG